MTATLQHAHELARRLEAVLADLEAAHDELLAISHAHRRAISAADLDALQRCSRSQRDIAARVQSLQQRGQQLVADLAPLTPTPPKTLREAARAIPGPAGQRLAHAADRLRAKVLALQRENRAVVAATRSVLAHIDGLIRQVGARLNDAPAYTPTPARATREPLVSALDLRS